MQKEWDHGASQYSLHSFLTTTYRHQSVNQSSAKIKIHLFETRDLGLTCEENPLKKEYQKWTRVKAKFL